MTKSQEEELIKKIEEFDSYSESSIENSISADQDSVNSGEYSYLVESHCIQEDVTLSEHLQEALDKSSLSLKDLIEKAIDGGHFKMQYEELSSPFQYGGALEDEFYSLQWGGDRECQIDKESVEEFNPSFPLNDYFESFTEFMDWVKYNVGNLDSIKAYWDLMASGASHVQLIYNTDYDVVRCILSDDEVLIAYLQEHPKPKEVFTPKVLKVTEKEYLMLRNQYDGFCIKCGKVNEGNHEPDAENYTCSHCEASESYGVEILLLNGGIEIVDNDEESNLDESY